MNNLIKTFKDDDRFIFNKYKFDLSYLVQFDEFGEKVLLNLINANKNAKILVGPLYNQKYDKKLSIYTNEFPNIKKVVASEIAFKNAVYEMGHDIDPKNVVIFPSGVIGSKELNLNKKNLKKEIDCLVYFKKRPKDHLNQVLELLNTNKHSYEVFEYGKYNNTDLKKTALNSRFGIFMSRPETQGFAAQELLSCNLPLLVWDQKKNIYDGKELSGTTITYWNQECGEIVDTFEELNLNFDSFQNRLSSFNPYRLIEQKLTFEVFKKNLILEFNNF
tara:strand:+ start:394 stop:1218 length:825 start_codon:yes stop_codon:yes gene_type:complete